MITYKQQRWSLKELFPGVDSPELTKSFDDLDKMVSEFEGQREKLTAEIITNDFKEMITQYEEITRKAYHISGYASLLFTENTQDQSAQALVSRVDQFLAGVQNRTLFFELWWKSLDDGNAERLMEASGPYKYWLEEMRHFKPFTLSEPEEKVINLKNVTGNSALVTLYDAITNRYVFKVKVEGELKELTRGQLMVYARHHDPDLRAAAYQELYRVYGNDGAILGQMYQTRVRDWRNEHVELRKYPNPISVRNLVNDIKDEVVDTLLEVCERNAPLFQRYFRLKAKWLGIERLRRYDIYAPVAKSDKTYPYADAVELVLQSFDDFEKRISKLAKKVFDENHIDSEVRKGKQDGAFCMTVEPKLTPWVKLNYQGKSDDVATMAHELGHAIHAMLASHHTVFTQHSCLPLAENASTFGEMLLVERLLELESDPAVRRDILFRQVDDAYATIMRQAFFALFEREAHDKVQEGATVDQLAEMYMENLREQFGDAVALSDEFRWEWVSIPHIYHYPFYVYAYSFGQLLVLSLYQQYKNEGKPFIPRYLKILEAGGSKAPLSILSEAGIDVTKAAFWQGGFNVVENMIAQLEALPIS
ncbi:MAG TPA: M3 family oligoendopeptidase [Anaerolineae bacterium]|nr:M3 family oligoendopeptidase [Anaerolineae bacterium]